MSFWGSFDAAEGGDCSGVFQRLRDDASVSLNERMILRGRFDDVEGAYLDRSFVTLLDCVRSEFREDLRRKYTERGFLSVIYGLIRYPQVLVRPGLGILFSAMATEVITSFGGNYRKDERKVTPDLLGGIKRRVTTLDRDVRATASVPSGGGARVAFLDTASVEGRTGSDFILFFHTTDRSGRECIKSVLVQAKCCWDETKSWASGRHLADATSSAAVSQPERMGQHPADGAYLFYHHDAPPYLLPTVRSLQEVRPAVEAGQLVKTVAPEAIDFCVYVLRELTVAAAGVGVHYDAAKAVTSVMRRYDFSKDDVFAMAVSDTGGTLFRELTIEYDEQLQLGRGVRQRVEQRRDPFDHRWRYPSSDVSLALPNDFAPDPPQPTPDLGRGPN